MSFATLSLASTGGGPRSPGGALTRGRIQGGQSHALSYPNPFFDIAHTYLPTTLKELFKYCRYYFLTNPLINATIVKLSEYPITDIVIDQQNDEVKRRWEEYFHEHLRFRAFQVESGLDYHCFGNSIISLSFPFVKHLTCKSCNLTDRATKLRERWRFSNYQFRLSCPACGHTGDAAVKDVYYKNASGIKLIRWNVEDVEITYNDVTAESTYFYNIPGPLRSDIVMGKKDVVSSIPQIFIQALRQGKGIIFSKDNLFHMKRPSLAVQDRGWGPPLPLPVLKDAFYMQLMKKAQEAILLERMIPLRVLFPQAASGSSDPFTLINLSEWKEQVSAEIARWRHDPAYIPIMPLPIGNQSIGGDGKALLLSQEMQMQAEHIIMGMGVPREFIQGGLSFSGSNVSMRMLENAFIGYQTSQKALAQWIMKMVASYMDWPEAGIRFKPFKMADDIQRKAFLFQLNQAQKISDTTLLADSDLNQSDENEIMVKETSKRLEATRRQQLALAEVQGEQQLVLGKYQARAQAAAQSEHGIPAPGEPGGLEGPLSALAARQHAESVGAQGMMQGAPGAQGGEPLLGAGPPTDENFGSMPQEAQSQLGMHQQGGGADIQAMAKHYADQILQMSPSEQEMAVQAIAGQSPQLAQLVQQFLQEARVTGPTGVDQRPVPEQRPERRAAVSV